MYDEEKNENRKVAVVKRNYKDSVFCHLFNIKEYMRELYISLHPEDSTITEDEITKETLENIVTNQEYNDLGFLARNTLFILMETQSTWSYNIVLMILIYYIKTLRIYISREELNLYSEKPIKIPGLELYVLFTGDKKDILNTLTLREIYGDDFPIDVFLRVITDGNSGDIIDQYINFLRFVKEQIGIYGRTETAIKNALKICKENNYLKRYLSEYENEVFNIMGSIYTQEEAIRLFGIEQAQIGKAEGLLNGAIETCKNFGKSINDTVEYISANYNISREDAINKVNQYWDNRSK